MKMKLQIKIESLAYGGRGVGRLDGKVCFVEGALPGEEVVFSVIKDKPHYLEGEVVEILIPSPDRIDPPCEYYNECGGCQLQHLTYEKELHYKNKQIGDFIRRTGVSDDFKCENIVPSRDAYNYRSSITLHAAKKKIGYYRKQSHDIIDIKKCLIAEEPINLALKEVSQGSKNSNDITIKSNTFGEVFISNRTGDRFFEDSYRNKNIYFSPKTFSQANRYISGKIVETLEEWIGETKKNTVFFDVYCGAGFFSFLINNAFDVKVGIDEDRVAIECAKNTLKNFDEDNIKFYKSNAEEKFCNIFEQYEHENNIVFLDPPRTGVKKNFLYKIKKMKSINRIYYLSCDPACLSRDIKILTSESDWKLKKVKPFDMFPRTKHIETLTEFSKT